MIVCLSRCAVFLSSSLPHGLKGVKWPRRTIRDQIAPKLSLAALPLASVDGSRVPATPTSDETLSSTMGILPAP